MGVLCECGVAHELMLYTEAAVGHKGQLDESQKGVKWFCGTKAVCEKKRKTKTKNDA